ncbi:YifB family Mg chelatase-like AAA ATPase [Nonomuraea soli]|uniref:Magnesium chelatase family protein n=1 Tax=Nonomuraea soli TaxID=1032476 RepID=A0A7W0HRU0_9ACTN|nr:YifB family Mg chelatase-like AAA ATPase [Nonomuraea soli]MBA2893290.1 magnesium chelatase family protein [Nonomuraea soli]
MAVARTRSVALIGVTARGIEVEADVGNGLAGIHLIGLPDTSLSEARDRVRSAMVNSHYPWPDARITVSLFPATLPKRGSHFDLAIAVAILGAAGAVPADRIATPFFLGELGLDGRLRPVRGILPSVLGAAKTGEATVVVPASNAAEAALVPDVRVVPIHDLRQLVEWLRSGEEPPETDEPESATIPVTEPSSLDLSDVAGQPLARRALEVCAAGGHNLWLHGPPGTGKTLLAERLPTLLPDLEIDHALEVTAIHSVAGVLPPSSPMITRPPFVAPHHTATAAALVGGGSAVVRPGAVSLAHRGTLFLDEAPEFPRHVLDCLRQPLESGNVNVSRAAGTVTFPARFMLILAANPCPCAQPADKSDVCECSPSMRRRYQGRLSGPLQDRIDLKVTVARSSKRELMADRQFVETSATVATRVLHARQRAAKRLDSTPWRTNAEIPPTALHGEFRLSEAAMKPITSCLDSGSLTARGLDRVVRVSWTIADLADKDIPGEEDTAQALALWLGVGA